MSTKQTAKKKPAAKTAPRAAKPLKPKAAPKPRAQSPKPRHTKILDHSACAVARALGKAGIKWAEADAIMRAHGIEMSKASLSVQLGFGRNKDTWEKRGEPAPLTAAQIKELRVGVQS